MGRRSSRQRTTARRCARLAAALAAAAGCGKGDERARPGEGAAAPPRDPLLDVALPAGALKAGKAGIF